MLTNLAISIERNVMMNNPAPISYQAKSKPIKPIPINKKIKFSNVDDTL
jgi:hypothetical protein